MARPVVLLHGWSATSRSMAELAAFVRGVGREAVPIRLGDYLSMRDDVRVEDAAKRMHAVVMARVASGELAAPFDLIVHSAGALVARRWLARYFPKGDAPVSSFVMLAPANFGSRLATLGRSMAARVCKTVFGDAKGFETGSEMLHALELASSFQWELAVTDLLAPPHSLRRTSVYGADGVRPFVVTGVQPLPDSPSFVSEPGSDGVVRVAAANLNAVGATIDFARGPSGPAEPVVTPWRARHGLEIPFAVVPDRDHLSILHPMNGASGTMKKKRQSASSDPTVRGQLASLLREALDVDSPAAYAALATRWRLVSEATAALALDEAERRRQFGRRDPGADYFHQHYMLVTRVRDDHGAPVEDYFVSFMSAAREPAAVAPDAAWRADEAAFHGKALRHVHANRRRGELRCLHIDRNALFEAFYPAVSPRRVKALHALITAEAAGDKVGYFAKDQRSGRGLVKLHEEEADPAKRWLKRSTPHLLDIIAPRLPDDDVFTLSGGP
jgi:hypothetical protein